MKEKRQTNKGEGEGKREIVERKESEREKRDIRERDRNKRREKRGR